MFSGLFGGGGSAKRAAAVAAQAQQEAGRLINKRYETIAENYQPYIAGGQEAQGKYNTIADTLPSYTADINQFRGALNPIVDKITSGNYDAYKDTPGYEFRMNEGQKALENSAAARGGLMSGQALKASQQYGQDYATSEYDNYLGRLYNQMGAVGTQIQGAQAGQDSAMGALSAYQPTINQGFNAENQKSAYGMSAAEQQAAYIAGAGATQASGMQAKANQMAAAGDQWLNMGAAALSAMTGGATPAKIYDTAGSGQQSFGGGQVSAQPYGQIQPMQGGMLSPQNNQYQANPWVNPDYITMGESDPNLPWLNQNQAQQRQIRTQSIYS